MRSLNRPATTWHQEGREGTRKGRSTKQAWFVRAMRNKVVSASDTLSRACGEAVHAQAVQILIMQGFQRLDGETGNPVNPL